MEEETPYAMSSEGLQELGQMFEYAWHNLPDGFGDAARPIARNFTAELLRSA